MFANIYKKIVIDFSKVTLIGLGAGLLLGLSVVYFRAAALTLENFSSNFDKALTTVFFALVIQTVIVSAYLIIFEKSEFKKFYDNKFYNFFMILFFNFFDFSCFINVNFTNKKINCN